MSISLNITFENFEDLEIFISDMNKFKKWKNKQTKKDIKSINIVTEGVEAFNTSTDDRRGLHQQYYHNEAKIYHNQHPEKSYRDCLYYVYQKCKKDEI